MSKEDIPVDPKLLGLHSRVFKDILDMPGSGSALTSMETPEQRLEMIKTFAIAVINLKEAVLLDWSQNWIALLNEGGSKTITEANGVYRELSQPSISALTKRMEVDVQRAANYEAYSR